MDPFGGAHLLPYPILTDGLKEDHPEWFDQQDEIETCPECGGVGDQHDPNCSEQGGQEQRWGGGSSSTGGCGWGGCG